MQDAVRDPRLFLFPLTLWHFRGCWQYHLLNASSDGVYIKVYLVKWCKFTSNSVLKDFDNILILAASPDESEFGGCLSGAASPALTSGSLWEGHGRCLCQRLDMSWSWVVDAGFGASRQWDEADLVMDQSIWLVCDSVLDYLWED